MLKPKIKNAMGRKEVEKRDMVGQTCLGIKRGHYSNTDDNNFHFKKLIVCINGFKML
ncbi:plug domain of TonB-dependent receptor [Vitreoscilla sp. C1]|nr:plug domain of TonB-dependent receptor [Vitreoscilla sp. C1]